MAEKMLLLVAILLSSAAGDAGIAVDRFVGRIASHGTAGKVVAGIADKVVSLKVTTPDEQSDEDQDEDTDDELEVIPAPALPPDGPALPAAPIPPVPPVPARPPKAPRFW